MNNESESYNFQDVFPVDKQNDSEKDDFTLNVVTQDRNLREASNKLPYSDCLIDRSGRQFVCFHEHCTENNSCFKNEIVDSNFDFQALHLHPDDKACLCENVFPDILKFMNTVPDIELPDYRFTYNHRYIRKDGTISQFLQEGTLSKSDDKSLPVLNLSVFTEIGDFKTDETMILSIFRYFADQGYQKVWTKVYRNDHAQLLSPREIEIIKLCLEGLSSKMIANKLNLSIHTVKNHKRNCMEKTLTHNITELIHLCMLSHLL